MADLTGVLNAALAEVSEERIQSFDDGSSLADVCLRHYADTRDAVLELYPWHWACVYSGDLARVGTGSPGFRWQYQYALPVQPYCLKVLGTSRGAGTRWEVGVDATATMGGLRRVIFSNEATMRIAYTARVEDLAIWTPLAIQILVKKLAAKLALPLTGQHNLEQLKEQEAQALIPPALGSQAGEGASSLYRATEQAVTVVTGLAQQAVSRCGHEPLIDVLEETVMGFQCRLHLPLARDAVLELHPWNFAKRQAVLVASATTPAFRWAKQFLLPPDVLTILGTDRGAGDRWERAIDPDDGSVLYSDNDTVSIEYIARDDVYDRWSALAQQCLLTMWARELVGPLNALLPQPQQLTAPQLAAKRQEFWGDMQQLLPMARARDAMEGYPNTVRQNDTLTLARRMRGGGRWRWPR